MGYNYVNKDPSDLEDKVGPDLNPDISSNNEQYNKNLKEDEVDKEFNEVQNAYDEEDLLINPQ